MSLHSLNSYLPCALFAKQRTLSLPGALLLALPVLLSGCSGDSVRVTTETNNSAETSGTAGASVGVSAESADGSQSVVVSGSGGETETRRVHYTVDHEGSYLFCIEQGSGVLMLAEDGAAVAALVSGCSLVELPAGELLLELSASAEDTLVTVSALSAPTASGR